MRRHRLGSKFAAEVIAAGRRQRVRIDLIWTAVLLGHQQPAGVPDRRRVGDRSVETSCLWIVGERIAILAEQRPPGGYLGTVPFGLNIADRETRLAAADAPRGNHAVPGKNGAPTPP